MKIIHLFIFLFVASTTSFFVSFSLSLLPSFFRPSNFINEIHHRHRQQPSIRSLVQQIFYTIDHLFRKCARSCELPADYIDENPQKIISSHPG